jgi:hypothetical protein
MVQREVLVALELPVQQVQQEAQAMPVQRVLRDPLGLLEQQEMQVQLEAQEARELLDLPDQQVPLGLQE